MPATRPATIGVAKLVPEAAEVDPSGRVIGMSTPGAASVVVLAPEFDQGWMTPEASVAATEMTLVKHPFREQGINGQVKCEGCGEHRFFIGLRVDLVTGKNVIRVVECIGCARQMLMVPQIPAILGRSPANGP